MVAGALAWMLVRSREYQATAQVLVNPVPFNDVTYTELPVVRDTSSDPTRAIQTAAAMLDSPAAAATSAQTLGPGWSESRVRAALTVTPIGGTNVVAVRAVADQQALAARIANGFVATALAQHRAALTVAATRLVAQLKAAPRPPPAAQLDPLLAAKGGFDPTFSILHAAAPPRSPTGPAAWRVLSIVLFAGLIAGVGVALLIDLAARRLRPQAEVVNLAVPEVSSHTDAPRA
jgi:capsular polysaccharide biosynthesis protein